jgi:hypothetical protein
MRAAFKEPDMQTFLEATVRLAFIAAVEREVEAQLDLYGPRIYNAHCCGS